jgi:RNA polymerase sigma-70 factor (ECF subfamily)
MGFPKARENWLNRLKEDWQDARLVRQTMAGDRDAFTRLYDRHAPRVFNLLRRLTNSTTDAEDLTQETFLSAYESLGGWRGEGAFSTWLCGIAYRKYHSARRKTTVTETLDDDISVAAIRGDPFLQCSRQEAEAALKTAIAALPDGPRDAYLLIRVEGMSYREAADLLGVPLGTVQSRLWRATRLLQSTLSPFLSDALPTTLLPPESPTKGVNHADQTL